MSARVRDLGKGIGRIEWRLNGTTVAVGAKPSGQGPEYTINQSIALDPGENVVEVVAFNAQNLLASLPAGTTVTLTGAADHVKPKLHVLAIAINAYEDKGWTPPGPTGAQAFGRLSLAVNDAKAVAAALKRAAEGRYSGVNVVELLDQDASLAGLERAVARLASAIHPRDTVVVFAAAHGTSVDGHFYLILQDYQGGLEPGSLARAAVSQDRLQDWLANRIKAKRAIVLLDTCESGALVSGYARSRNGLAASEAAVGRLHEATGRPVLTAAAEGEPAFEGFEGHGVFTWALLDALKNGDRNGNNMIELSELVAHVQDQVPRLSAKLNGRGRAAVAVRGSAGEQQSARFGSRGANFVVVGALR
jgi:uncharacterized caspase-like protein